MSPHKFTSPLTAVLLAGASAQGMIIYCDGPDVRLVTTEHQRPAEFGYQHAVAAASAENNRGAREASDMIGQTGNTRVQAGPAAPGTTVAPRPVRPMVQRDRAAQAIRLSNRGLIQLQSGKLQDAIDTFEQAMKLNPGDGRAVMLRGVAAARQGRNEAALEYYNRALEIDPGLVEAYQSRGLALMKLDRLPKAVEDFTKAVTLNPKFEEGFVRRGLAYGRLGEYSKAVADNSAAIALNPKNPLSYNNRAAAYRALGQNDQAEADLEVYRRLEAEAAEKK